MNPFADQFNKILIQTDYIKIINLNVAFVFIYSIFSIIKSKFIIFFVLLILLFPFSTHAKFTKVDEQKINELVKHMTLRELLGQTLILGHRDSKELRDLIKEYTPGGIIVFEENFPKNINENDKKYRQKIWDLTNSFQDTIHNVQPDSRKIPLIISIDQEGGGKMEIKYGVTRTPDPMYIGATRSPDFAMQAGEIIGTELKMLGINTVLGPVADINNNDKKDVVGKRSFGAHKDLVAPMAVCFMQGLKKSGVLSIGKHYPGHGDAEQDPHLEMAEVRYADNQRLQNWDMYPFEKLIEFGVNGLMTAHLIVPPLDNQPITISSKAINEMRKSKSEFNGIVITDDIATMMGILTYMDPPGELDKDELNNHYNYQRTKVMRRALEAGSDMVMFANIGSSEHSKLPQRTVIKSEFHTIYQQLYDHFSSDENKQILKHAVKRILRQKINILPIDSFNNSSTWQLPLNEKTFQNKRKEHTKIAKMMTNDAVIQITDNGKFVNKPQDSKLFEPGYGPLSQGRLLQESNEKLLIVSPVYRKDTLTSYIKNHNALWFPDSNIYTELLVYGWKYQSLSNAKDHWGREIKWFSRINFEGEIYFSDENITERVNELIQATTDVKAVVFGLVTKAQIKILQQFLDKIKDIPVIVILSKEPYFLPSDIYKKKNVSVLFAPALPDEELAVNALFGTVQPKTIANLPFNIPGTIEISRRDVYLKPETNCQLKKYSDYHLEAWQGYNEAKRLLNKKQEKKALEVLNKATVSAEKAIKFASPEHQNEAKLPLQKIDELILSLIPDIE